MHYHMILHVCDESGFRAADSAHASARPWDCSLDYFSPETPPLTRDYGCLVDGKPSLGSFLYQFQGGPAEEGALILPPESGVPVGGRRGKQSLVIGYHFPSRSGTIDGTSGVSDVDIILTRAASETISRSVGSLQLAAYGFLAPAAISSITASWTLDQDVTIQMIRLYTHWHDLAFDVKVRIVRPNGDADVILEQDPRKFWGVNQVPNSQSAIMRYGDRLTIQCSYNNTLDKVIRVE